MSGNECSGLVNVAMIRRPSVTRRGLSSAFYYLLFINILSLKNACFTVEYCVRGECVWHIPRIPLQVTHEAPRNPSSRCAFFSSEVDQFFFSTSFSIHDGAVTAELKTWLKTLKPSLRIIALPPLTPDSPTRTRPGTAGPITWVRLRVKVTELSTHSAPVEVKPKHEFMTKPQPEEFSCETLRPLRLLCTILHCCLLVTLGGIALSKPSWDLLTLELWAGPDFLTPLIALVVSQTDYHRCQKALDAKGVDTTPCDWYQRVYKSLCPMSWVCFFIFNLS